MPLRRAPRAVFLVAGLTFLACLAGAVPAAESAPEPAFLPLVAIERQGYAFEYPRVLAEQRLFGIAHGVGLLAEACRGVPAQAEATAQAYARWREQQHLLLDATRFELARFYFGPRASEAEWGHLVRALNLRERLALPADSPELAAACASLPQALQQPRYDLATVFQLEEALAANILVARAETQAAACATRLPEAQRPLLQARFAEWQAAQEKPARDMQARLAELWTATQRAGKAEEWMSLQRKRFSNPPSATCARLADWLASPAASVAGAFTLAPTREAEGVAGAALPPVNGAAQDETQAEVQTETQNGAPLPSPQQDVAPVDTLTPAPVEHGENENQPNLFDLIMRFINEQPQDPPRARSQRAYP